MNPVFDRIMKQVRKVPFRGKLRLLSPFVPKHHRATTEVFGCRLDLDLDIHVDRLIYMGCYEPLNVYRFRRLLSRGDTVVDVGANIGFFTLLSAGLVGDAGRVLAIEPHPMNFDVLSTAVSRNVLTQVTPIAVGLDRTDGRGEVRMPDQSIYPNRTASMDASTTGQGHQVTTRALDSLLREEGIEVVDLLKIDVDGFESRIIEGAAVYLREGRVRNIIIEFSADWLRVAGTSADEMTRVLEDCGFQDCSGQTALASFALGPTDDRHFSYRSPPSLPGAQLV